MSNLKEINDRVSSVLREENNEVVYRAWLNFAENSKLIDGNIVITVPNQYIKETLEDRYIFEIEALYKNDLSFSKLIIITEAEEVADTFKKADSVDYINNSALGAVEKIMLSSKQFTVSL
jgi:chromosomal replication initiation ATPase DnaA